MGFKARWLAVKGGDLGRMLELIGLRIESQSTEAVYDPGLYAVKLPSGWVLVIGDGRDHLDLVKPEHARALSANGEALHLSTDDTSMCAALMAYRDGAEMWSLEYDGSEGARQPSVTGAAPEVLGQVIARLEKEQHEAKDTEVDFLYDAAAEVGLALTGFRHDQTLGDGDVLPIYVCATARQRSTSAPVA